MRPTASTTPPDPPMVAALARFDGAAAALEIALLLDDYSGGFMTYLILYFIFLLGVGAWQWSQLRQGEW